MLICSSACSTTRPNNALDEHVPFITFTSTGRNINFVMTANGPIIIYWGDGSRSRINDVSSNDSIFAINVQNNLLTRHDVSNNIFLTHLFISGNQFTALEINNIISFFAFILWKFPFRR